MGATLLIDGSEGGYLTGAGAILVGGTIMAFYGFFKYGVKSNENLMSSVRLYNSNISRERINNHTVPETPNNQETEEEQITEDIWW